MSEEAPKNMEEFQSRIVHDVRPWGLFRRFPHQGVSSIKIIAVNPGGVLSLQYHHGRDEFWLVLDEGLEMTVGDRIWRPAPGEEVWIPKGTRHRARGVGERPARVLELWIGDSEESDIVRVEDVYQRG
ncbi:MAG: phosphomannose isomerase type II C-terminal cupin domain [Acidobacteriota bacterium]